MASSMSANPLRKKVAMAIVMATFWNEKGEPARSAVDAIASSLSRTASSRSPSSISRLARHSTSRRANSFESTPAASTMKTSIQRRTPARSPASNRSSTCHSTIRIRNS